MNSCVWQRDWHDQITRAVLKRCFAHGRWGLTSNERYLPTTSGSLISYGLLHENRTVLRLYWFHYQACKWTRPRSYNKAACPSCVSCHTKSQHLNVCTGLPGNPSVTVDQCLSNVVTLHTFDLGSTSPTVDASLVTYNKEAERLQVSRMQTLLWYGLGFKKKTDVANKTSYINKLTSSFTQMRIGMALA